MQSVWKIENNHIALQTGNELLHPNAEEIYAVVNILVLPLIRANTFSWATVMAVTFVYLYYNLKINGIRINYSIIYYDNKKWRKCHKTRNGICLHLFCFLESLLWMCTESGSRSFSTGNLCDSSRWYRNTKWKSDAWKHWRR